MVIGKGETYSFTVKAQTCFFWKSLATLHPLHISKGNLLLGSGLYFLSFSFVCTHTQLSLIYHHLLLYPFFIVPFITSNILLIIFHS